MIAMNGDAKPLSAYLTATGSSAATLLARAERILDYRRALRDWAETRDCGTPRVANFRQGILVIHADSAAACTALRYRANELLLFLQDRLGAGCSRIEVKVRPGPGGWT